MSRFSWSAALRVLALLVTAFFVAGAVLQAVLAFDVLGPPPPEQDDFIEEMVDFFAWEQTRWPVEFAASAIFALAFIALGGLGALLSRLAATNDPRRLLTTAAFLGAGGIGAASQLMWIGVKPIATSPQYCECGLRAEEIMSRLMVLNIAQSVQVWLVIGAIVLLAAGTVLLAGIGREAGHERELGLADAGHQRRLSGHWRPGRDGRLPVRPARHHPDGRNPHTGLGAVAGDPRRHARPA